MRDGPEIGGPGPEKKPDPGGPDYLGILAGLVLAALLVGGFWLLFQRMRCDPFYSDTALSRGAACR